MSPQKPPPPSATAQIQSTGNVAFIRCPNICGYTYLESCKKCNIIPNFLHVTEKDENNIITRISLHCNLLQGSTGKYREIPVMKTGVPCNEYRSFPVGIDLQGFSVSFTGFGFAVWVSLRVKCCMMIDSVPRWQLSLSGPKQSDNLTSADDTPFGVGTFSLPRPRIFLESRSW